MRRPTPRPHRAHVQPDWLQTTGKLTQLFSCYQKSSDWDTCGKALCERVCGARWSVTEAASVWARELLQPWLRRRSPETDVWMSQTPRLLSEPLAHVHLEQRAETEVMSSPWPHSYISGSAPLDTAHGHLPFCPTWSCSYRLYLKGAHSSPGPGARAHWLYTPLCIYPNLMCCIPDTCQNCTATVCIRPWPEVWMLPAPSFHMCKLGFYCPLEMELSSKSRIVCRKF